ncbi:uncharacterized protein ACR2FA_006567 [Aphomia sociella]
MKSKSFDLKQMSGQKAKLNKTYDFISLYKPAGETNKLLEIHKPEDELDKENSFIKSKPDTSKRERSPNKKKKNKQEPLDISRINIDGPSLDTSVNKNTPLNESKVTSTPQTTSKGKNHVKSIMKNSSIVDDSMECSKTPITKPKKRNKSVSFMLDDTEEVVKKKTKSDTVLDIDNKDKKGKSKKDKSFKTEINKYKKSKNAKQVVVENNGIGDNAETHNINTLQDNETSNQALKSKKFFNTKSQKRSKDTSSSTPTESNINEEQIESKKKRNKKKKADTKTLQQNDNEEPVTKSRKVDVKPEVIVENLENLTIGDNAHTLSNLLDEMTVADKNKRKKFKRKMKREKAPPNTSSSDNNELEKNEGGKERVKWHKRKWNRDKKGDIDDVNSVIVENLPLTIMCNYKKLLMDHFQQYGIIKRIGVAEVYPTESADNLTFGTTIVFYSEGAASKALEANNTLFEGNHIKLMQKLPPNETTIVVRSYATLTDQNISTVFSEAGRIRNIRHLIKGKKSIETVFVEFDNPEAVKKAEIIAKETKIEGKRIHVNKYEMRKKNAKSTNTEGEEGDSEDSND